MSIGPTEPAADLRAAANIVRQMYVALVHEGFSEAQALAIIGAMLAAQARGHEPQ